MYLITSSYVSWYWNYVSPGNKIMWIKFLHGNIMKTFKTPYSPNYLAWNLKLNTMWKEIVFIQNVFQSCRIGTRGYDLMGGGVKKNQKRFLKNSNAIIFFIYYSYMYASWKTCFWFDSQMIYTDHWTIWRI